MPDYICSSCGRSFEASPDTQGNITCVSCGQVMPAANVRQPLPAGTRIDGYVLIRHLGSGGSGSVYLAEQTSMERTVALKILDPERMDRDSAERFLEEARNAAKFENPHVVAVIDSRISGNDYYYIAMQYVDGETLETMLQHGRIFSEEETLRIGITVAESLQAIWNKYKMFHKDIKPGNIMLTRENQPMILDMGTAQKNGESRLADGNIEGSPYYMSPEQARGEVLTWSTDLYSLGTTLYQMVTGKYPYDAPEVEAILRMHDSAPFPEPAERSPDTPVSERMTGVLRRMMGKTPADRYGSWDEFIRDARKQLEAIREKSAAPARGNGPDLSKPVPKPRKVPSALNFVLAGVMIFILAAALLGSCLLYIAGRQNTLNAKQLLGPIRKQADELMENPDPDAVDELIRKAEPYFDRIGILPSVRAELNDCREKTEKFRELLRQQEQVISNLEVQTAECLKAVDEAIEAAKQSSGPKAQGTARKQFDKAMGSCNAMLKSIRAQTFVLKENIGRQQQLVKRLVIARKTIQREQQEFKREQARRAAARPAPPPRKPEPRKPEPTAQVKEQTEQPQEEPTQVKEPPARTEEPEAAPEPRKPEPAAQTPAPAKPKPVRKPPRKPKPAPPMKPAAQAPADPEQEKYQRSLEQEKDRIRAELLLRPVPRNLKRGDLVWVLRFQPDRKITHTDLNLKFNRWLAEIHQQAENADSLWQAIVNSRKAFAGFQFTIDAGGGKKIRMNLRTILGDTVYLQRDRLSESRKFNELDPQEWSSFLAFAARKSGMMQKLDSLRLLEGRVFEPDPGSDPFIRQEMPEMRKTLIRLLSGEKIPGTDSKLTPEILRKYRHDAGLPPNRTGGRRQDSKNMQPSSQKGRP
ncbi:MAG: serine/threonine protein kinase [Lentisphaeria bacterium]|nr:serine/threonine protein kinase [Lentisphaeria bacterium]